MSMPMDLENKTNEMRDGWNIMSSYFKFAIVDRLLRYDFDFCKIFH